MRRRKAKNKAAKTYIALFMVLLLGMTLTFAWFAKRDTAQVESSLLEFQSASSLRVNKEQTDSSKITISAFTLDEASSLDGRNIYFPLGASFSGKTADMLFREGNAGDRITGSETGEPYTSNPEMTGHYVYKDFQLKGTSGNTPVYIKSYEIKIEAATPTDHDSEVNAVYHDQLTVGYDSQGKPSTQTIPRDNCPIRLAFIADSGVRPVVIDPSAQVVDYVDNSNIDENDASEGGVVSLVDANGVPTRESSYPDHNWNSFATYYYGNTPLFVIPGGETIDVTLVIWLEGTLPNCDKYIGKQISVDIDIESNFADMETITFIDGSYGDTNANERYWVSNDDPIVACSYEDPFSTETPKRWKTVIMTKTKKKDSSGGAEWQAKIPKKAVTKISFYRLSKTNGSTQSTIYNAWHTTSDISTWITASQISNDWYMSGSFDLQTTREYQENGVTYRHLVYTAVHGNGYSDTPNTNERLAPCVGYWGYSGGSGSSSSGGGSSGGGTGGGSSQATYNVTVIVDSKDWVASNVAAGSVLHFTTTSGGDYYYTSRSNNHFEQTFTLNNGDEITGFYLRHSGGGKTDLTVNAIFTVSRSVNVQYVQQNNDTLTPNLLT